MAEDKGQVTQLLIDWGKGDRQALSKLTPLVYDELRRIARGYLRKERGEHTLQATALVHEAFVRMVDQRRVEWRSSLQFTGLAAQMMRRILVDHARSHRYAKRGGGTRPVSLDETPEISADSVPELIEVDMALEKLSEADPDLGRLVELRFFGGLTSEEVAEMLGVSVPTVNRRWRLARAWLYRHLQGGDSDAA
jgi:RNA polymerase sigma factor (TIGR02999 family)